MKTFRLIKSSLGITIFLFSFYIIIRMLFFQNNFSWNIFFDSVINFISKGLFQSKSFYFLFIAVFLLLLSLDKIKNLKK
jgi:hypothetical protein